MSGSTFGIDPRLSNQAKNELLTENKLNLQNWLKKENMYVFTINGFLWRDFMENL